MTKKKLNIHSHGFKTPEDYFESFDEKLFSKLSENSALPEDLESGFKAPENYFENLEDTIFAKLDEPKVVPLMQRKKWYAVASMAAVVLISAALFFQNGTNEDLTVEMVENYFVSQELDSYELAELLSETNYIDTEDTFINTEFTEDNIETYLLNTADIESYLE
ncbi:hypothetical protein Q2T40_12755 [Winogradskyella maritima]|uniref:DUF4367 domain-containing protein n=1 Tax=Winogradskyella maritima TaxID=1517766 RepID=A0ABV8AIZ2_9FLAO|nr:hypothetical protein [Winogradskyella maritima]